MFFLDQIAMTDKIQFTKEGYEKLIAELENLKTTGRPNAVQRLSKARSMGDLSENSEYHAAKEELAFVEGRIQEIEEIMKNAQIIDSTKSVGVNIGDRVTVDKNGTKETFSIVGEFEADPMTKKLSVTSPIGKALIGKKEGEKVTIEVPAGKLQYKILKIKK